MTNCSEKQAAVKVDCVSRTDSEISSHQDAGPRESNHFSDFSNH